MVEPVELVYLFDGGLLAGAISHTTTATAVSFGPNRVYMDDRYLFGGGFPGEGDLSLRCYWCWPERRRLGLCNEM